MNKGIYIGNLTRDPESRTTPNNVPVTTFTIAVKRRFAREGEPDADFIKVQAWRELGKTCAKYLKKGRKVAVFGTTMVNSWTDTSTGDPRAQIVVDADEVEFLPSGNLGNNMTPVDNAEAEEVFRD